MIQDWEPRALPDNGRCDRWAEQRGVWFDGEVVWTWGKFVTGERMLQSQTRRFGGFRDKMFQFRPMRVGGMPVPWSEFYAATHPPIPEEWEKVGEWFLWGKGSRDYEYDTTLTDEGEVIGKSERVAKIPMYGCHVRRVLPSVPEGWDAVGEWVQNPGRRDPPPGTAADAWLLPDGTVWAGAIGEYPWVRHIRKVPPPADWGDVPKGVELNPMKTGEEFYIVVFVNGRRAGSIQKTSGKWWMAHGDGSAERLPSQPAAIVALTGRRE